MSTVHARFKSPERELWWNIDSAAASHTGCLLPCEYETYETQELEYEYDGFDPEANDRFRIQVRKEKSTSGERGDCVNRVFQALLRRACD